ncbi:MAG: hypothetical protein AAF219_03420 [Myxococcota bacterium]
MTGLLERRLGDSEAVVARVRDLLDQNPDVLCNEESVRDRLDAGLSLKHLQRMYEARTIARTALDGMEGRANPDEGTVLYAGMDAPFVLTRLLATQAYLSVTWALADLVTGFAGSVLCPPEQGGNPTKPAKLVSHFLVRDRSKKSASAFIHHSLRPRFGWPVSVFYAIRNSFIHDGAQCEGRSLFAGAHARSAFRLSEEGWKRIESCAEDKYKTKKSDRRDQAQWPSDPTRDLREVFRVCESEMDEALNILLGSAFHALETHVRLMLGEEWIKDTAPNDSNSASGVAGVSSDRLEAETRDGLSGRPG